jgi:hypothetical protein
MGRTAHFRLAAELSLGSARPAGKPADQPTEQQPGLRRKVNVGRHADEDPKRHADRRAYDGKPGSLGISGSSTRHRKTALSTFALAGTDVAGAEGLEPPAYGFGDRRSTN